jgi:endonuclease/exonuclease/phosphatase family metal-dependent hydrolase
MGSLTLLSWNVCCIPGGYSISDGGVMPWPRRFQRIVDVIREKDPDILSLQEVDTAAAFAFYEALKDRYAYFYVNIGSQAIGPSSWLFVASKFEVKNPEFVPFKKEDLHGRSKSAMKGVFSFDIDSIHIISTHLGHSEVPKTKGGPEATARKKQMEFVMSRLKDKPHALLAGDLNMGPGEFAAQNTGLSRGAVSTGMSWGGDAWCKKLSNEEISPPMNLDYIAAQGDLELSTELVETRYNGTEFNPSALSDHSGLLATVKT